MQSDMETLGVMLRVFYMAKVEQTKQNVNALREVSKSDRVLELVR